MCLWATFYFTCYVVLCCVVCLDDVILVCVFVCILFLSHFYSNSVRLYHIHRLIFYCVSLSVLGLKSRWYFIFDFRTGFVVLSIVVMESQRRQIASFVFFLFLLFPVCFQFVSLCYASLCSFQSWAHWLDELQPETKLSFICRQMGRFVKHFTPNAAVCWYYRFVWCCAINSMMWRLFICCFPVTAN